MICNEIFIFLQNFRNFHARIKSQEVPITVVRFYQIFKFSHKWNKIMGWEDEIWNFQFQGLSYGAYIANTGEC